MNATDSQLAAIRRWRSWWLAVPLVPLSVFAAVVGYDQLQAQQQRPTQGRGFALTQDPGVRNQPAATIPPAFPQPTDRQHAFPQSDFGSASDAFAPTPNFRPSHDQRRPAPAAGAQAGFATNPFDPARQLADELRQLDPQSDGYDAKRAELEEAVAKQFDDRHQQQKLQLSEAQQRLMQLQMDWKNREAAKDQIVARRINELLGEPDPLRWDTEPTNALSRIPGMPYTRSGNAPQGINAPPARYIPESVQADDIHYYATPVPYPDSTARRGLQEAPDSRTAGPVTSPPTDRPVPAPPLQTLLAMGQEANRVAGELARCIQEINAKQDELRRLPRLYRPDIVAEAKPRLVAEITARRQQQKLLELQLEQLAVQTKLKLQHAKQTLEAAEKRLQVAREPLDDTNPTSLRQQQRDIAEAETKRLDAQQQLTFVEQQVDHLKRLRDTVGKVNQQEMAEPEDTEDEAEAGEAGDAAEAVAY